MVRLLLILAHARLPNYQNCLPLVLLLSKTMILNIVKTSMKGPVKIFFKSSCEVLNKLKSQDFPASSLSTNDFSTLCTTLFHNLIKDKLVDLIKIIFQREGSLYIACNNRNVFFTSDAVRKIITYGLVRKCVKLSPFS